MLTGFRVSSAGYWGYAAPEDGGWVPDIFTFGKVIGGGMPIAALAGKRRIMEYLAPVGPVYQAGTLSGNPLSVAAGIETLTLADEQVYKTLDARSAQLRQALTEAFTAAGVDHSIQNAGNLFSVAFGTSEKGVHNYADVKASATDRYTAFFHSMLESGVYLPPSAFEAWFVSAAHDDAAMDRIISALPAAAAAAASA